MYHLLWGFDVYLLGTSSIDTTCTIWGLEVCITCYGGLTCIYWAHRVLIRLVRYGGLRYVSLVMGV